MKTEKRNSPASIMKMKQRVPKKASPALHLMMTHENCPASNTKAPIFNIVGWKGADMLLECPKCNAAVMMYVGTGYSE